MVSELNLLKPFILLAAPILTDTKTLLKRLKEFASCFNND